MSKKNWRIFYPLLLGIYAAVGLVGVNISQMVFSAGIRSILVAILFSFAAYAAFCWRIKDEYKAALCLVHAVLLCIWSCVWSCGRDKNIWDGCREASVHIPALAGCIWGRWVVDLQAGHGIRITQPGSKYSKYHFVGYSGHSNWGF
jgi:hypothetical protein